MGCPLIVTNIKPQPLRAALNSSLCVTAAVLDSRTDGRGPNLPSRSEYKRDLPLVCIPASLTEPEGDFDLR